MHVVKKSICSFIFVSVAVMKRKRKEGEAK